MSYPIWKWAPNWDSGVRERISWLTSIETSQDGSERRERMRPDARTTIEFDSLVIMDEQQELSMMIQAHQAEEWLMPLWWDVSFLELSTADALVFDSNSRDFGRVGSFSWAVIVNASGEHLAVEIIQNVIAGYWATQSPIDPVRWPAGSRIYPARVVQLSQVQPLAHVTAGVTTLGVDALVVDNRNYPNPGVVQTLEMLEPNRRRPISATLERLSGVADFGVGPRSVTDFAGRSFRGVVHDYLCANRHELAAIRRDLSVLAGRLNTLRMPTFQSDRTVSIDMDPFWVYLWSKPAGYKALFDQGVDLYIKPLNGQGPVIARAYGVSSGDPLGDEIEFDPSLPIYFKKDEVKVSLVYKSRLSSDTVEITHHTPEVSEVSIGFRSIK